MHVRKSLYMPPAQDQALGAEICAGCCHSVSASEISSTQELNELWNALPVEDVVELKHFIEHYAIAHGLP